MARPRKQEVDYFPHYCDHGKVLFILESHFKNDGYAVFYKLEELLAKTEGHCYDCSELESWEYLLSKMATDENVVTDILKKLSAMNIIDQELWKEKKIWMQSFVDSISDVYARRKVDIPVKPELLHTETPLSGINDNINPQSKLKKIKLKENKEKKKSSPSPKTKYLDSVFLTPEEYEKLKEAIGQKSLEAGIEKLNYSILSNGKKYKDHYLTLLNWHNRGFIDEYMQGHKKYAGGARSEEPVYTRKPMTPDEAWAEEEKKLKEKEG